MKIDEAIGLQSTLVELSMFPLYPNEREAIRLGIEALRRIKSNRESFPLRDSGLLLGETE